MDNFLDRYQVPKLNQDQINDLNSPICPKEIEAVINSLPGANGDDFSQKTWNMARKLKIMENEKHPLDDLKNDEITKIREK